MTPTSQTEDMRKYFLFAPPPYPLDGTTSNDSPPRARRAGLVQGRNSPGGGGETATGRIEPYITTPFLSEKELNRPILFKSYRATLSFKDSDYLRQIFKLPQSIAVESYVAAFQHKVINSILSQIKRV